MVNFCKDIVLYQFLNDNNIYICVYIYIYIYMCVCIYIYVYVYNIIFRSIMNTLLHCLKLLLENIQKSI